MSDCELQDVSITPLLNALQAHKTVAVLDISHNSLGKNIFDLLPMYILFPQCTLLLKDTKTLTMSCAYFSNNTYFHKSC